MPGGRRRPAPLTALPPPPAPARCAPGPLPLGAAAGRCRAAPRRLTAPPPSKKFVPRGTGRRLAGPGAPSRALRAELLCLGPRPLPLPPSCRASPAPCRSRGEPGSALPAHATAARPHAEPADTKRECSASRPRLKAPRTLACTPPCPGAGVSSSPPAPPRGSQPLAFGTEPGSPPQPLSPAVVP